MNSIEHPCVALLYRNNSIERFTNGKAQLISNSHSRLRGNDGKSKTDLGANNCKLKTAN